MQKICVYVYIYICARVGICDTCKCSFCRPCVDARVHVFMYLRHSNGVSSSQRAHIAAAIIMCMYVCISPPRYSRNATDAYICIYIYIYIYCLIGVPTHMRVYLCPSI